MEISFIKLEKDGISSAVKFTSESDMFAREEMYADGIIEELWVVMTHVYWPVCEGTKRIYHYDIIDDKDFLRQKIQHDFIFETL